jgi:hypothetical protein
VHPEGTLDDAEDQGAHFALLPGAAHRQSFWLGHPRLHKPQSTCSWAPRKQQQALQIVHKQTFAFIKF